MSTDFSQAPAPAPQSRGPVAAPAQGNGLAVAGFVVSLVATCLCLIPFVNNVAFFLALVGLALAIVGVVKARRGAPRRGLAIAGIVLAVVAGIGVLASQAFYGAVIDDVVDELDDTPTAVDGAADNGTTDEEIADAAVDTAETETAPDPKSEPEPDEAGTRDNPYAFSETVSNDDWTVDLGKPYEAWAEIEGANMFNEAPADGTEYWIVPVEATYTGTETGTPWMDLTVEFVGDDNVTYNTDCGVVPDDLINTDELYEGGSVTGNECVAVPAGAKGTWTLTAGWFSDPVFFRAKG